MADQTVTPAPAHVKAALADFSPSGQSSKDLPEYIVDGPGLNSYPLCLLSLLVQSRALTAVDCGASELHIDHIVWLITNEQAGADMESDGYASLPAAYRIRVLNWLALLTCNGERRLRSSILAGTGPNAPFMPSMGLFYGRSVDQVESQYIPDGGQSQLESGDVDYSATLNAGPPPADYPDFRYLYTQRYTLRVAHKAQGLTWVFFGGTGRWGRSESAWRTMCRKFWTSRRCRSTCRHWPRYSWETSRPGAISPIASTSSIPFILYLIFF
jgi:hypothetical protein